MSEDILRELDDEMRQQRLKSFWLENRLWIMATIVLAIVATAGVSLWRAHLFEKNTAATGRLMQALQTLGGVTALAQDDQAIADIGRPAHRALARLSAAERLVMQGKNDEALAQYEALAADRRADSLLRDLARIYAIGLQLDSAPADQLEKQLAPLARSGQPWRFTALELRGLLYAREGRMKEAADTMAEISAAPDAPQDARTRAFSLREFYQADAAAR